jgi:hypothetical protein
MPHDAPPALSERVEEVRGWALSRIRACREQETKFVAAWEHREKHSLGPPQALVEAWTERRSLQTVLEMLSPDYLDRVDALAALDSAQRLPIDPAKCRECGSITSAHRADCSQHASLRVSTEGNVP